MRRIKVIVGKENSGKSTIAEALVCNFHESEIVQFDATKDPICFAKCGLKTNVIIIDNVESMNYLINLIANTYSEVVVIDKLMGQFNINPQIIIVCKSNITKADILDKGFSISRRVDVIETLF